MDATTLEEFKTLFTELYKDSISNFTKDKQEYFVEHLQGDQVDQSQSNRDQMLDIKLKGRENFYLRKLETALRRIESGTYGECEDCGGEISIERLRARPTACMCIQCKEEQERDENSTVYTKRSHTTHTGATLTSNVVPLISHDHVMDRPKRKLWAVNENSSMS